jgi:predicted porin
MYEGQRSQNRARYDSPLFAGFQIKVSSANTEKYAVGATWATKEDSNFQVRVAAGYTDLDNTPNAPGIDTLTSISASALLGMGVNFTVGYGSASNEVSGGATTGASNQDVSNIHGKVGYIFSEKIAVAIRYMTGSDVQGISGQDAESIGIAAQWSANEWLDVYGGIESASVDVVNSPTGTVASSEDLVVGTVGLKVSF